MSNNTVAGFRLSAQQERIWSQQTGRVAPFWVECEILVEGTLDAAKLQEVVRSVVARHEILRTVFPRQTGLKLPFQVILDTPVLGWQTVDLTELDESAQHEQIQTLVNRRDAAVDLEQGPVLDVVLARLSDQKHAFVLSLPALCADLRSLQTLATEIGRAYANRDEELDDVMQYADVAEWQQELLSSDDTKPGRDYWRDYCRRLDFSALDSVLSAFEAKSNADFSPEVVVKAIELSRIVSQPAGQQQEFLLACWQVFVSRMTGRPSITVGCQLDGRNHPELANALGAFSKYLPLDSTVTDATTFDALHQQMKRDWADFSNWQDSFSWSNAGLAAGEDQGPILPIAFDYAELSDSQIFGDAKFTTLHQASCGERFRLKLSTRRQGDRLWLEFHFDSAHLDRETIERWSKYFLTLVEAAVGDPQTLTGRLPLLEGAERSRMLVDWNQTAADYPRGCCLHDLFEAQAAKTPDLPAVRFQNECMTYRELNEQANQLAHFLRGKGVGPDSLVGLCVDRSISMMVAVLAVMKAGGAYVPLGADHPKARLAQQLAGAAALVTEAKFECQLPSFDGPLILLEEREQWSGEPLTNPQLVTNPENLVYVIYTSGSTGTPKGVAVRHRNLVNYTSFIQRRLELEKFAEPLHFATVSTLGADLGNTCIYPALVSGGCLHVIAHDVAADSQRMREYMTQHPVDVLKIVPSHLMALLNSEGGREVLPRKYLVMGGEALTRPLVEKIVATGGSCEILNHYGPTETTVGSLTLRLKEYDLRNSAAETVPIGRPIANTRLYVLDAQGEPVPIGVAGELYVAGDGVTAGYINQPEKTAERFVPEPFASDAGAKKMYRTGDLVRYLPDGNVEFLGRVDDQVKIRGFRVELGEVESVLLRHGGVKQAAVLALTDERGEKSVVGYVVGAAGSEELRSYLRGLLPDYMVPAAIVELPKLPLNANGKIDRQALPKPEDVRVVRKQPVAPRTPSEEVIAAIWEEVLRRDGIGVEDNFFEIGGHSLLATQIASRLREHFRIPVAVRAVFEAPTIAGLAKRLDIARREEQGLVPPPITSVPRNGPLPLSFAQERLWVLDQIEPNNPLYNIPRTLRLKGTLNASALEQALNEIVRRHESQRTTFAVKDGRPVQVITSSLTIPLDIQDLTGVPEAAREDEARRIAVDEALRPFDLTTGPLVRTHLLRLADDDHVLLLTMHHIISDAWSAGIFMQELCALYESFAAGNPSPLPELTLQYADYAAQERQWLQGEVLEKQIAFWREQLRGVPAVLDLPLDHARPKVRTFHGACEMLHVPLETLRALKELARQEGATLFMTLMAGFQALLSRYSGHEQIVVGTDLANRTTPETERMIGFFINLLAVRTDLSGNPTFRELLGRVREGLLESYAHQELPFDKIVHELQPERSATHNPIVQVLFVMQNIPRANRELAGLRLEGFAVPTTTSKFDMAVFVAEKPDELIGYWIYSTELFEQATIQRMLRHFGNLLQSVVAQPDARLSGQAMLSPEEIEQQEAEKKQRKQSQFKKLKATAPEPVGLPMDDGDKPPS